MLNQMDAGYACLCYFYSMVVMTLFSKLPIVEFFSSETLGNCSVV
jgi:hypothetical protein